MIKTTYPVAVGHDFNEGNKSSYVTLHVGPSAYAGLRPAMAKYVATQILMMADFVEKSEKAKPESPEPRGDLHVHKKTGNIYRVLHVGQMESTQHEMVVYQSTEDQRIWIRPLPEFNEKFTPEIEL
jgi:hypothetical protein